MGKKKPYGGYCCPALHMVVSRARDNERTGVRVATIFQPFGKRMRTRPGVVVNFSKAQKHDTGEYGKDSKFAHTTYGEFDFCPFCGIAITEKGKMMAHERFHGKPAETAPAAETPEG